MSSSDFNFFKDSKIRDKSGNLLPVYHGSSHKFSEFSLEFMSEGLQFGGGIYFTVSRTDAETFAKRDSEYYVYEAYVDIQNPFMTMQPLIYRKTFEGMSSVEICEKLKAEGYDGVIEIFWDGELYDESVVVVFDPKQIRIEKVNTINQVLSETKAPLDEQIQFATARRNNPQPLPEEPERG